MKEKLDNIYKFLSENRKYNQNLQEQYYSSWVCPHSNTADKIISILYKVANTQSQPKIDQLSKFYRSIYEDKACLESFNAFTNYLGNTSGVEANYQKLFNNLKSHSGWGEKTSALFTKNIYHMHSENYPDNLKVWKDVPMLIKQDDMLMLPVDIVIKEIFKKMDNKLESGNWSFNKINKILKKYYKGDDIAIWDDLWFWGFIAQYGSGENRELRWNINKYWMLEESNKESAVIDIVERKANEFLKILQE